MNLPASSDGTSKDPLTRRILAQYSFVSISFYSFILAFLPLYFQDKGFNASELSLLSAISTLTTVIAPMLILELVHRRLPARRAAQLFMLLSPLSYLAFLLPGASQAAWALPIFFFVTLFKRALDTLLETETIRRAALGSLRFEHVRVWGSIGFVVASFIVGGLSDLWGTGSIIFLGLPFLFALVLTTMRSQSLLEALPAKQGSLKDVDSSGRMFNRAMTLTVIATSIAWASHGPFYVYFSVSRSACLVQVSDLARLEPWRLCRDTFLCLFSSNRGAPWRSAGVSPQPGRHRIALGSTGKLSRHCFDLSEPDSARL